jgi:hypothetical protein
MNGGLRSFGVLMSIFLLAFFVVFTAFIHRTEAAQRAIVQVDEAVVLQSPNNTSLILERLKVDRLIMVSSEMVRDVDGEYWYKVKLGSGEFGYIRISDVSTPGLDDELRDFGVDMHRPTQTVGAYGWIFAIRAMGLGGGMPGVSGVWAGGEGEATLNLLFFTPGYLRRMLAVGCTYSKVGREHVVAGTLVYRFYTHWTSEPELRFRLGTIQESKTLVGGFNFGWRYPFSLNHGIHMAAYFEAGSYRRFAAGALPMLWASAGLGFHL